jgi:hypothetical protein
MLYQLPDPGSWAQQPQRQGSASLEGDSTALDLGGPPWRRAWQFAIMASVLCGDKPPQGVAGGERLRGPPGRNRKASLRRLPLQNKNLVQASGLPFKFSVGR